MSTNTRLRRKWTDADVTYLRANYPNNTAQQVATALGRSVRAIYDAAKGLGLKKSAEFLASPASGRTNGKHGGANRFAPGLIPWNKGKKGLQIGGTATQFKRGSQPANTQPIGSYRITKDGALQRKISSAGGNNSQRWRGVHELVWIEQNGPVPPGHIVVFKPGLRSAVLEEITVDRVECISFADNMRRNTLHRYPKEIAAAIQMRGALNRRINREQENNR